MLSVDRRTSIFEPPPYDGSVTNALTIQIGDNLEVHRGKDALGYYGWWAPKVKLGDVLFHGSYKPPSEIGAALLPQQAYSRRGTGPFLPHGEPAICTSIFPDFPIVRSFFKEGAPGLEDYPQEELLLANRGDGIDTEYTIITREALERVRRRNPTSYVYVLHKRSLKGTPVKKFPHEDGRIYEYHVYGPAQPEFVMPITVEDLPTTTMVVPDTATGRIILDHLDRVDPAYFASDDIQNVFGDPYFQ